jgi:hypothetical protein
MDMKTSNIPVVALGWVAAAAIASAGCSSSGSHGDPTPPAAAALTQIEVSPGGGGGIAVQLGSVQFTAIGTFSDGSATDVTEAVSWTSSDASVAAISNGAGTRGLAMFAAAGLTEITASDPASGVSTTVNVEALPAPIVTLDLSPLDPSILIGTTLQLTATATLDDVDGTTADLTNVVTWTSSDETIATVSAGGLVTALALGTASITAVDPTSGATATTSVGVTDVLGLSYVVLSRGSVIGGGPVQITGTAVLTAVTDEAFALTLWSTDVAVVTVPEGAVVPAGADRVSFAVETLPVSQKTRAFVWASDGEIEKRASLNVRKQR